MGNTARRLLSFSFLATRLGTLLSIDGVPDDKTSQLVYDKLEVRQE
jgi:hypothetical protein